MKMVLIFRNSGESPKKKKKTKKVVEGVTSQNEPSNDVPNIVVFNESGASEDKPKRTRPKRKSKEREKRTVFVGNVPVTAEKKVHVLYDQSRTVCHFY